MIDVAESLESIDGQLARTNDLLERIAVALERLAAVQHAAVLASEQHDQGSYYQALGG